jgi:hypothetical protein
MQDVAGDLPACKEAKPRHMNAGEERNAGLLAQTIAECGQQRETLHALIAAQEPVSRADILVLALLLHGHVEFMRANEDPWTYEAKTQMLALCERLVRGIEAVCQVTAADLELKGYDVARHKGPAVRLAPAIARSRIRTRRAHN